MMKRRKLKQGLQYRFTKNKVISDSTEKMKMGLTTSGTYSGPLPGLVGHTEGLMALHTWKQIILM